MTTTNIATKSAVLFTTMPLATIARVDGPYLYALNGIRILNFHTGIAVDSFGEGKAEIIKAAQDQLATGFCQSSPSLRSEPIEKASTLLAHLFNTGNSKIFWCNSGAEANEASLKMARAHQEKKRGHKDCDHIITFQGSFHGRSAETVAAAGGASKIGMGIAPRNFNVLPYNDLAAVEAAINDKTAGILVEPVQGEGGIIPATPEFMQGLRHLANKHDILLAFDEVQCGMGRTGMIFAHQHYGVVPDLMSLGKALGGGIMPVAATVIDKKIASALTDNFTKPFDHGSTFGGSPLATAVAHRALE